MHSHVMRKRSEIGLYKCHSHDSMYIYLMSLWFPSMCQSELGEATLYSLREIGVAKRNVVLIGFTSEIHSLIRVTETCMPSPLRIPLTMFGIVCTMRSIQVCNSTLEISVIHDQLIHIQISWYIVFVY